MNYKDLPWNPFKSNWFQWSFICPMKDSIFHQIVSHDCHSWHFLAMSNAHILSDSWFVDVVFKTRDEWWSDRRTPAKNQRLTNKDRLFPMRAVLPSQVWFYVSTFLLSLTLCSLPHCPFKHIFLRAPLRGQINDYCFSLQSISCWLTQHTWERFEKCSPRKQKFWGECNPWSFIRVCFDMSIES